MNPVVKVKDHLFEAVHTHDRTVKMKDKLAEFQDVLLRVGIGEPERILESYPFELSGGMCQRVMVAMGIVTNADVLIADEPTSSLDLTTQAAILEELLRIRDTGVAILLITHDLGVVAQTADDMYVIKDGKIVEGGPVRRFCFAPTSVYEIPDERDNALAEMSDIVNIYEVDGLGKTYEKGKARSYAVYNVGLTIQKGEILGLVGESGCG